jgi:hypothetical protein
MRCWYDTARPVAVVAVLVVHLGTVRPSIPVSPKSVAGRAHRVQLQAHASSASDARDGAAGELVTGSEMHACRAMARLDLLLLSSQHRAI